MNERSCSCFIRHLKRGLAAATLMVPLTSSAVVGGADTPDGKYPFAASIQFKQEGSTPLQRHGCSASLIASDWVLTAAHCLLDTAPSDIEVIVGRWRHSSRRPRIYEATDKRLRASGRREPGHCDCTTIQSECGGLHPQDVAREAF